MERALALSVRKLAMPSRYEHMTNPLGASVVPSASAHWADHCALCHANDGSGNTTIGKHLYPRAPDMRAAATQQLSDGELYYIINRGVRFTGMPAWGEVGDSDRETWALVAFIRSLPTLTEEQVKALKMLNPLPAAIVQARQEENEFLSGGDSRRGH